VAAIILGAILGGVLLNPAVSAAAIQAAHIPGLETPSRFAVAIIVLLYVVAGIFNLYIPRVAIDHKLPKKTVSYILHDFWHCFRLLWRDPLGQVSLAVTTLFWGAGATLRLIILAWALAALNMPMNKATILTAWVALGIAVGSMIAAKWVQLDRSVKVLPVGIGMWVLTMAMVLVRQDFFGSGAIYVAIGLLVAIGAMAGYFVVPMNALLQHRGHLLMGAGHSIAVQNFNENLSILVMLGLYATMEWAGLSVYWITVVFGLLVSSIMTLLWKRHRHDQDRGQM